MARDLGSAKTHPGRLAGGRSVRLAGALSYSELGINFPSSGGEYVYLTRAFGPAWGFMTGWISFFAGFSAPIAAAALAFSNYLGYFYPAEAGARALRVRLGAFHHSPGRRAGHGLPADCGLQHSELPGSAAHGQGAERADRHQDGGDRRFHRAGIPERIGKLAPLFRTGRAHRAPPPCRTQFVISLLWVMVAYSGWNAATYVAEELKHPERTLPAALAAGTALVTALFIGLNLIFIYSTPLESMKGVLAVGSLAASNLFGPQVAGTFSALMALSLMATVNAEVTIGPRVYYAMAKNKAFFKAAAKVHPEWHTPVTAILSQGLCAMLMTLTPFPQLVYYIGFSLTFFSVLSVASLFIFRRRPGWQKLRPVSFCFPAIPLAYILVGACMIAYGIVWQPVASVTALATIGAGAAVYHVWLRPREVEKDEDQVSPGLHKGRVQLQGFAYQGLGFARPPTGGERRSVIV
jgi:APA family basic amino acid/polyamine antiporter